MGHTDATRTHRAPRWHAVILVIGMVVYGAAWAAPSWTQLHRRSGAKDHASFHYAVQAAAAGQDPYDAAGLQALAEADGVRTEVYPWIYPPPALLAFSWTLPLDFRLSQSVGWVLNHVALAGLLVLLRRWFAPPLFLLGATLALFSPLQQSFGVGQINPTIALLAAWGFSRRRAAGVAGAAWIKMSPAILVVPWVLRRQWRPLAATALVSLVLVAAALPLAAPETQLRFFTVVLPGLGAGTYNGMSVPLDLNANHSLANVFHQLLPSGSDHALSAPASALSKACSLGMLAAAALVARTRRDPLGEGLLFGALATVMVVTPAYTYEHHLVLLLPAVVAAWTAGLQGRLPRWSLGLLAVGCVGLLWPLDAFRQALRAAPELGWVIRESKLVGALTVGGLCLWAAHRSPRSGSEAPSGR